MMLEVRELEKTFSGFRAVNGANLQVERKQIVAVIGPNGAGKTTLFNLITGILKPDGGRILFHNEDITGLPAYQTCRKGITRSFQVVNIFSGMSVFENVQIAVLARQRRTMNMLTPANRIAIRETEQILDSVGLTRHRDSLCGALSHGDRKVLEIAIALGGNPKLLILDEPTAGMSSEETTRCIDLVQKLRDELDLTILFCEHDMEIVFGIADQIMVMVRGATIIQGPPHLVRCNEKVQNAYLGQESDAC